MTCEQYRELLPAYLTGDVTPPEREAVRAHVASGCPACAGALAEDQATFALVGLSLEPVAPPARAKDRLMARARAGQAGGGPPPRPGAMPHPAATRRWAAMLAAAACLALVATIGWHLAQQRGQARRVAALTRTLGEREARLAQLQSLVTANQLSLIALGGQGTQPGASGRVFWDRERARWHVFAFDLKPPLPGREYELWFITPEQKKVPAGTFNVDAGGNAELVVQVPPGLGQVALAAVTDEPAGGSPQPTGAIHLVGEVR